MAQIKPVLPRIRLNDRIAIFGRTGTGKSILAHYMFRTVPIPKDKERSDNGSRRRAGEPRADEETFPFWRICIDVTDSVWDDSLAFTDPENIPWDQSYSLRFIPSIDTLEYSVDQLYQQIMGHGSVWAWLDEANEVSSAHRTILGLRKALLQGRKFQVGLCNVTPRPVDINRSIITQSEHIISFALTDPDDRKRVANNVDMDVNEFDDFMANMPEYGYLWYDVRSGIAYSMPPLPLEIVTELE